MSEISEKTAAVVAAPPQSGKYVIKKADTYFLPAALALGIMWCYFRTPFEAGVANTLYLLVSLGCGCAYLTARGHKQTRKSLPVLAAAVMGALYYTFHSNAFYACVCSLLLVALCGLWLAITTETAVAADSGALFDELNVYVLRPLFNFGAVFAVGRGRKRGAAMQALLGLVIALPLAAAALALLSSDAAFAAVLDKAGELFSGSIISALLRHIGGAALGAYIFARYYGAAAGSTRHTLDKNGAQKLENSLHFLPQLSVFSLLAVLCAVYVFFLLSQSVYFFSAFRELLPRGFTYAEYARRGFFEICALAVLNAAVIAAVWVFTRSGREKVLRGFSVGIAAFTLLLIATAFSKLLMYIGNYGLTLTRVNAAWFMAVLAVVFILIIIRCCGVAVPVVRTAVIFTVVMFLALCWSDPDALTARYNIAQYERGAHSQLDVEYVFSDLAPSAWQQMTDYAQSGSARAAAVRARIEQQCAERQQDIDGGRYSRWQDWTLDRAAARRALAENN